MNTDNSPWWLELKHGGMIISPVLLKEVFPEENIEPPWYLYTKLREHYLKFKNWWDTPNRSQTQLAPLHSWLDIIFEDFLQLPSTNWLKGSHIPQDQSFTNLIGEKIKPNRLYLREKDDTSPSIALFSDSSPRLGIGKSRKQYGKLLEYLRAKKIKLGILTNGIQVRLCYAGLDHDSWVEWDVTNWFEGQEFLQQLYGFYTLLGKTGIEPRDKFDFPLLNAIENSRTKQGELSSVLGEQVRQSIEVILDEFGKLKEKNPSIIDVIKNGPDRNIINDEVVLKSILQATIRIVMRLVVIFFAEARDLLPKSNEYYYYNYGLEGLFEQLRKASSFESDEYLEDCTNGWLRLSGLFRMIYFGSQHPNIQIPQYSGQLFEPGNSESPDPVKRALSVFEHNEFEVSNNSILKILENLKYGKLKIKQGRNSIYVKGPVDFRELRTEFIGMIYEGILDYELRTAKEPMVLINAGLQPILPLSVLENLKDKQIKDLFEKLKKTDETEDNEELSEEIDTPEEPDIEDEEPDEELEPDEEIEKTEDDTLKRAAQWAGKAVVAIGWVKKPKKQEELFMFEHKKDQKALSLVKKVFRVNEYYLSKWGGTRKGTGTFYTKPQLAIPTVRRTLEPLLYKPDEDERNIPRIPEEIISIKVCDPACGSGSFLVAAINNITNALYDSLIYHEDILNIESVRRKTLPLGLIVDNPNNDDLFPCFPDDDYFEEKVKAKLKRYVVENCIYGVDNNTLAVELTKLSLWIETLDKNLPFEFLDHKIKTGNSLVGAWLDTFQEYPLASWLREGGDKTHSSSVNHEPGKWTKAIKDRFYAVIKPEMVLQIKARLGQTELEFEREEIDVKDSHKEIFDLYIKLQEQTPSLFGIGQREKIFYDEIVNNENYRKLKYSMNQWCSLWFWPGDLIDKAPTPLTFYKPIEETKSIISQITQELNFFHWEIEFPDVFNKFRRGFDAVIGNPPWEINKPNSKEFFSNYDPIYRTYGKQEAMQHQNRIFNSNNDIEYSWMCYNAYFKAMANLVSNIAFPFGNSVDGEYNIALGGKKINEELHSNWKNMRNNYQTYSDCNHPYRSQGSADLNTYKMFLEYSYAILKNVGRIGMIVPSGIYSDKGTQSLRQVFMNNSKWELIYSFQNKEGIFDIHRSFKFNPIIIEKGSETDLIKTAFMQHKISNWDDGTSFIPYKKSQVLKFSPLNLAFLEIITHKDLDILNKVYDNSILLGNTATDSWNVKYSTEYHMTSDSKRFYKRNYLIDNGFKLDLYGRFIKNENEIMLPLYQGVMIWQFDFCAASYEIGAGNRAQWNELNWREKRINSQFYIDKAEFEKSKKTIKGLKLVFRDVSGATNQRTTVATLLYGQPCGNVLGIFQSSIYSLLDFLILNLNLNSFVFDYVIRQKMVGSHLNLFVMKEAPLIKRSSINNEVKRNLSIYVASLTFPNINFSHCWLELSKLFVNLKEINLRKLWAITEHERIRLRCILDASIADLYGLNNEDLEWILKDDTSDLKGFWRVDSDKPVELRQTTLTMLAFKRLKEIGIDEYLREDWQFPAHIQEQLGPRFLDWQMQGTPEESWAECEYHAKQILGEEGFNKFIEELDNPTIKKTEDNILKQDRNQFNLFNNEN